MRRLAFVLTCITCITHCRRLDLKHAQTKEASHRLRALAKHLLAFNPGTEYVHSAAVDKVIGDRGLAKRKHQLRSSMPLMVEDAASVEVQIAQLQAQMEILKRQKEIRELQAQLAAMQQQQGQVMQPVQPPAPVMQQPAAPVTPQPAAPVMPQPPAPVMPQPAAPVMTQPAAPVVTQPAAPVLQPPASITSQIPAPVTSPPAQLAAVQQQATATVQPAAPVMPPAEPLQPLAAQSAQVLPTNAAALPVEATPAADAGDPLANAAGAVSAVQDSIASIWQQGEEGLSMIFQRDAERVDGWSDYPAPLQDWQVLTFVGLIVLGVSLQQLSLGDVFGEEKDMTGNSVTLLNRDKQRRSMYVKGGKRRPFERSD